MGPSNVLVVYDSSRAAEYLDSLYNRQGTQEKIDSGSYLYKNASVRDLYQHATEKKMNAWEAAAGGNDVVNVQLEVSNNLQELNALSKLDWEHTDPGFGLWLLAKIGQSNQILDKIESEHPELKPSLDPDHSVDLLLRSEEQRNLSLQSIQRNIDSWNVRKHKDPKATHNEISILIAHYKAIADGANWSQIDNTFSHELDRLIENSAGLQREIERAHPELK